MATKSTISLLQSTSATYSATNSVPITVTAMTAGSGCYIALESGGTTINRISSISGGGTWARATSTNSGTCTGEIWYLENATGGTTSITVSLAASLTGQVHYAEFSGILASGSLDTNVANVGTGASSGYTASSGNTATVAQEVELVMEFDASIVSGAGAVGINSLPTNYTNITRLGNTTAVTSAFNYLIRTGAVGTQSASTTVTGSFTAGNTCIMVATFKAVVNVIQPRQISSVASNTAISITAPRTGNGMFIMTNSLVTNDTVTSVTQTNAVWTVAATAYSAGGSPNASVEIWSSPNASASAGTTITVAWTGGGSNHITFAEFYGIATSSPLDKTATNTGSTNTTTWGTTATTTFATELAIACSGGVYGAGYTSPANGYLIGNQPTTVVPGFLYNVLNSLQTTTTSASDTLSSGKYGAPLATFKGTQPPVTTNPGNLLLLGCGA